MTNIYILPPLPDAAHLPILYPLWGRGNEKTGQLFQEEIFRHYDKPFFEPVSSPASADFILIPHIYKALNDHTPYLKEAEKLSRDSGKPLLLFVYGDDDRDITLKNTIVFRYSIYRYRKKKNEIAVPLYAPDGAEEYRFSLREKKNVVPSVGFCGWAAYRSTKNALVSGIKNFGWGVRAALGNPALAAHKKGIYFRKKSLAALGRSPLVTSSFIVRDSFSLHKNTVSLDHKEARRQFLENIAENDFSLALKGDGNGSIRFYEILSLGRIPIIVDTESIFPLEDLIDYRKFCFIVPFKEIPALPERVRRFYDSLSGESFKEMERLARGYFEKYLRTDAFYRFIFSHPEEILKRATPSNL